MQIIRYIDTPFSWAVAGFVIGAALGVSFASVALVAVGLGAFVAYLHLHGAVRRESEGRLFAGGPAFVLGWMAGFVVNGLAL